MTLVWLNYRLLVDAVERDTRFRRHIAWLRGAVGTNVTCRLQWAWRLGHRILQREAEIAELDDDGLILFATS